MINTVDITTQAIDGDGVFDALMKTSRLHLIREFQDGRIKGNDYATVYTGMLNSVMQASVSYALQKNKVEADTELVNAQLVSEQAMVDASVVGTGSKIGLELQVLANQAAKILAEENLVNKKTRTECAQTEADIVTPGDNSVIGKQLALYEAQAVGYDVDQKVKVAKLFADTANVQLTINDTYNVGGTGLEDVNIRAAMNTVRESVGATT